MKNIILFLTLTLSATKLFSQNLEQTIRGHIQDKESKSPIVGATIALLNDSGKIITGVQTDYDGNYRIEKVSLGRRKIKVFMVGYQPVILSNLIVDAGKELILNIEMEESVSSLKEVTITASTKGELNNEMATISAKTFSIEETNRYAGSRSDPARMASNFAGVQGADDSRNDIVIRGNSPMGLLWRIEGVDVPNPNHFAVAGTTGGAISILNNKMFGSSDFFTGAFPAEYGNANAGVFDIRLRNGNNEKREFSGQFGFLGTEFSAEGPLSKKSGSTYLLAYRYSTLKMFESLKIKIGTSAVPAYQDLSFKLNFPAGKAGNFAVFGVGGTSDIDIILSDKPVDEVELYGENDRDQHFGTSMGLLGLVHTKSLNEKTFIKTTIASYVSEARAEHDIFIRNPVSFLTDSLYPKLRYNFFSGKNTLNFSLNHKASAKNTIKVGFIADHNYVNFNDSLFVENANKWDNRVGTEDNNFFIQGFIQWKHKFSDEFVFNTGLHTQYFSLNGSLSIEPRAGVRWSFRPNQALAFAYGLHSQALPSYVYYHHITSPDGTQVLHNKNVDFIRSHHLVLGYDYFISKNLRLKAETYYQYLFDVPVETYSSSFSLINQGSMFSRFFPNSLVNKGKGTNYGVELTLEKSFSQNYFFMLSGSLYQSTYEGSDGVERSTDYNGNYATNLLLGKEFIIGKKKNNALSTGFKITWAGGKRYSPADTSASLSAGELVVMDSKRNSLQFRDYFRIDLKIGYKINRKKLTHEIAIDLVNLLNTKNVLGITYSPDPKNPSANPLREEYQLGFLPLFYYKVDF